MSTTQGNEVVKVAVKANNKAILFKLDQDQPLERVIEQICIHCGIIYTENEFALRLLPQGNEPKVFIYLNESNRYLIKNGRELKLEFSPQVVANQIIEKLQNKTSNDDLSWAIKNGAICSTDQLFCKHFYFKGYSTLQTLLNELLLTHELYVKALEIVLNLVRSNFLKTLDREFLLKLIQIITNEHYIEAGIVKISLEILEAITLASKDSEFIRNLISMDDLVPHLWNAAKIEIQTNTLALINAIALKSISGKIQKNMLQKMNSKQFKDIIYTHVIPPSSDVSSSLANALFIYQSLILTLEKDRYKNAIEIESLLSDLVPYLKSDQKKGSETDSEIFRLKNAIRCNRLSTYFENRSIDDVSLTFSTNSFVCGSDDETDDPVFISENYLQISKKENYISQLTLDCVFYFYNKYNDDYKVALMDEGSDYIQFLRVCDKIVDILSLKVLRIGNIPENGETAYIPLFFLTLSPFYEELFCKAINLLHKTKREMKAKSKMDLDKVFQVLQRQLQEAMLKQPTNFAQLEAALNNLSYWTVKKQWFEEQEKRDQNTFANSSAIKQLRESLVEETKELVKTERLKYVKNGTEFPVLSAQRNQRLKNKTWFAILMPNEKGIQYKKDEEEHQIMVQNIKSFLTGKRCTHIKQNKLRDLNGDLAFSLVTEEETFDFIAPSQEVFDHWTDAINILLGKEMKSTSMKRDLNCLLDMELRLRLLETEGIELPSEAPPIPLEPPNYDFGKN